MQNPRTAINDDDPRQAYIRRLADAWKPATTVATTVDNNDDDTSPHHVQHDAGRVEYINSRIADRMSDSRVVQLDSVGPSTLPSTGAALRQIREDRQRQGGIA